MNEQERQQVKAMMENYSLYTILMEMASISQENAERGDLSTPNNPYYSGAWEQAHDKLAELAEELY